MNFRCKLRVVILFLFVCNWGVRVVLTADDENINVTDVLHTIFGTIRRSDRMEVAPSNATGQDNFAEESVQQSVENIPQHLGVDFTIDSTLLKNAWHMYLTGGASIDFCRSYSITAERFHRNIELETRGLMPPFDPSAGHDDRFHTGYDPPGVQWSNSHFQNLVNAFGSSDEGTEAAPSYAADEDYYAHQPVSRDSDPEGLWYFWSRSPWSTSTAAERFSETMTPPSNSSLDTNHADRDADEQIDSPRFLTFQDLPDVPVSASDGTQSGALSNVTVGDELGDQDVSERSCCRVMTPYLHLKQFQEKK